MERIDGQFVKGVLPPRDPYGHKGTFGKVLCVGGHVGYTGAPVFMSRAAVRTGSGLVYLAVPECIWGVVAAKCDEVMAFPQEEWEGGFDIGAEEGIRHLVQDCDAVAIGCGMGRGEEIGELTGRLLTLPKPLVLDADGLNALAGRVRVLKGRPYPTVLTPHEVEFARLGGDISQGREAAAEKFATEYGVYLILKGHETVVAAPDGRVAVNTTGDSGMAKGGSGDLLTGMVLSLLGQGMDAFAACCAAVYLHGLAGDMAAGEKGERGMTPTDLLEYIPYAIKETEK